MLERETIYQRVWGYAMAHGDRSVDVFIRKLRQKLEKRSPELGVHPHPLRGRLPVRPGADRGRRVRERAAGGARVAGAPAAPPNAQSSQVVHKSFTAA